MRYRALSATGDYTFGQGQANFLINSPAMVGQSVKTRLLLWTGNWFLDVTEGTPWSQKILGANTKPLYDLAIQQRILETPGVKNITKYSSLITGRNLTVNVTIDTIFSADADSTITLSVTF